MKPESKVLCIFCSEEKDPSTEHVVSRSLGGNLAIRHVCRECNNTSHHEADSHFCANYYMARAYKQLAWEGKLAEVIKKAEVTATDRESLISMKLKVIDKNEFRFIPQELEDGSRIVSEQEANEVIQRIIDRRRKDYLEKGVSKEEIESYQEKQAWI